MRMSWARPYARMSRVPPWRLFLPGLLPGPGAEMIFED